MKLQEQIKCTVVCAFLLLNGHHSISQCDSAYYSITTKNGVQELGDLTVTLSSATNAQALRSTFESITGYYLGDENKSEEIIFSLNVPITKIKIYGGALSAVSYGQEFFTLRVNEKHHRIQPYELITPDPAYGRKCTIQANGSLKGDSIVIGTSAGHGSFILTYENPLGITSFQIKDSITFGPPNGAIFDVQIYTACFKEADPELDTISVFIPNVFTPSNDGKNEIFKPIVSGELEKFSLKVLNRWGQIVYSETDPINGWNGENSESGVYFWVCSYKGLGDQLKTEKGTVTLIR